MAYYIYHIPGIKIGCTSQLQQRMRKQGFTEWEILEEHTDILEASNREIQLQKDYGYTVDTIPYWKSVEHRLRASSASGKKHVESGHWARVARLGGRKNKGRICKRSICPHCNKEGGGNAMKQWHFDNCKHKKTLTN